MHRNNDLQLSNIYQQYFIMVLPSIVAISFVTIVTAKGENQVVPHIKVSISKSPIKRRERNTNGIILLQTAQP